MLSRRSLFSLSDGNENAFATVVNVQLQSSELIHCEKRRRKYSHQTKRKEYCNKKIYLVERISILKSLSCKECINIPVIE